VNLTWIVRGQVAAMGMPWPEDVERLVADGFAAIVSLTSRPPEGLPRDDVRHLHLPIRDFQPPTQDQIAEACAFIDAAHAAGGPAVVHCGAGLGRTGTIIAAWLVTQGRAGDDAIDEVRRRRPGSVETPAQEHAVLTFEIMREKAKRKRS
jgi:atypical dual specificity phosphatase